MLLLITCVPVLGNIILPDQFTAHNIQMVYSHLDILSMQCMHACTRNINVIPTDFIVMFLQMSQAIYIHCMDDQECAPNCLVIYA